jgi:malonyl-CoA/methylmalonyl-CoA synthetase
MTLAHAANSDPFSWLDQFAQRDPERLLLETPGGRRLSYADMARLAKRIAGALLRQGVEPGDRVVAQVDKSAEAVALYLACLRIGAVFVPLNTAYTAAELEYFLEDAAPKVTVGPAQLDATGGGSLMELANATPEPTLPAAPSDANALAALLYTSGTTGRSKGAMLTRGNLASNALTLAREWRFTRDDVLLHALPIFHVHGLFVAINTVLAAGSAMLFLPKFSATEVVQALPRATVMMGVPTFYTRLLEEKDLTRELTAKMRLFISGSAPLPADTHREFRSRTGHAILERYGMSETLMNTSNPYQGDRVPGSVGPALPGVEVRITDPKSGAVLRERGAIGMIEVRGPNVFRGYWRMPDKTAAELRSNGFFVTGDLGRIDERGYLYIVGRVKDVVITGGYNVYPSEVERELNALPGIAESAVIGVPHPDFGEAVAAVVIAERGAALDEAAIRTALELRLAKYKVPKRVVVAADLPRNAMGKIQKATLREQYADLCRRVS